MVHQKSANSVIVIVCASLVALIAPSVASANESSLDLSIAAEHEMIDSATLDLSMPSIDYAEQSEASVMELPEPRSQLESFATKCAELEAVPLLELTGEEDKEVFLGINFDGYLGFYARQ